MALGDPIILSKGEGLTIVEEREAEARARQSTEGYSRQFDRLIVGPVSKRAFPKIDGMRFAGVCAEYKSDSTDHRGYGHGR